MLNWRQKEIIKILSEEYSVKLEFLSEKFGVSDETIRRDLKYLEEQRLLKRTHGGAVLAGMRIREIPYGEREIRNRQEKRAVGRLAADFIEDGDSLVISNGTSTQEFAKALCEKKYLQVITNSIVIANELIANETNDVLVVGGRLRKNGMGISGLLSVDFLEKFRVDKAIMSVGGVSLRHGITEFHLEEAAVLRKMIEISVKKIVLADYSKLTQVGFNRVCGIDEIDVLICDWNMPIKEQEAYRKLGIEVRLADRADF